MHKTSKSDKSIQELATVKQVWHGYKSSLAAF